MEMSEYLTMFVRESNAIEGIRRDPSKAEIAALKTLLDRDFVLLVDLDAFVRVYQPDAMLRERRGMNVCVGDYIAPDGGPQIAGELGLLLEGANNLLSSPHGTHLAYERLHPFTDCNGRSGRALWLWMMWQRGYRAELGFLHKFYYQTLESADHDWMASHRPMAQR